MKYLIIILLFFSSLSCKRNCTNLPDNFKSYIEALSIITSTSFKIEEDMNTDKSSWINGVKFYSCDGQRGFLIIKLNDKKYVHKDVPFKVWQQFKKASSFGRFYNTNIKNNYVLTIEN